ncbi:MAG: thermonuclease family protein [bacterium]
MEPEKRELPRYLVPKIIFLIVSMSFPFGWAKYAARQNGLKADKIKVIKVYDGDTILVQTREKKQNVRLYGIDAPEVKSRHMSKGQPYGNQSTRLLAELVEGKIVKLERKATDKYGRLLAVVFLNGQDICLEMVKGGLAWRNSTRYRSAQEKARSRYLGLWADPDPVRPRKWRKLYHRKD